MPKAVEPGSFYEFDVIQGSYEVGREILEASAQMYVRGGWDVYTPRGSDAKSLAKKILPSRPIWHPAENPRYFSHYHPAPRGDFGHIFYGARGENSED
jgi:hypothetical protein